MLVLRVLVSLRRAFPAGDSAAGPSGGHRGRAGRRHGRRLAAALLIMAGAAPPAAADRLDRELRAAVDGVARSAYAVGDGRRLHVPGVVLGVRAGGRTRVVAAGLADLRTGRAMRPGARQPIGSVSKVFTAVLVMRLVERGLVRLDDTVPGIAAAHDGDGGRLRALVATFEPRLRRVSVRDLLAMTSGIRDYQDGDVFLRALVTAPLEPRSLAELSGWGLAEPLAFSPGARGRGLYSSTNFTLLAMIVEAVSGDSVVDELRGLFRQAGLRRTTYDPAPRALLRRGAAHGYVPIPVPPEDPADERQFAAFVRSRPGRPLYAPPASLRLRAGIPLVDVSSGARRRLPTATRWRYRDATATYSLSLGGPAGGFVSTQADLVRFFSLLHAGRLVRPATLRRMEKFLGPRNNREGLGITPLSVPANGLFAGSPALTLWGHAGEIYGYDTFAFYFAGGDEIVTYTWNVSPGVAANQFFATRVLTAVIRDRARRNRR
jgi:CubicO group peptidase (beta-lactamase class C family)